jgi:hypothetical protein
MYFEVLRLHSYCSRVVMPGLLLLLLPCLLLLLPLQ